MTEIKRLEMKKYPKMVEEFAKENFNLKMLTALLLLSVIILLLILVYYLKHGPTVIALGENGQVTKIETKITDLQIESAVREYLRFRYNWDENNIPTQIAKAQFFVLPEMVAAFHKSMQEVQKYVKEKRVTQRVYPKSIIIDIKAKKAVIVADRINEFESLKAATEMRLSLYFTVADRSVTNPWGIFITKEVEGVAP